MKVFFKKHRANNSSRRNFGLREYYPPTSSIEKLNSQQKNLAYNNEATKKQNPNILFIIADDLGLDALSFYDINAQKAHTPNLNKLAEKGVKFTNFWTYPTCSPTRASIITGKYDFRTNVRKVRDELSLDEIILQKYIYEKSNGIYNSAVIGKWHLSRDANHPNKLGLGYYAGLLSGAVKDYNNWILVENGRRKVVNEYITTKFTNLAINWINKQKNPWFLWLAYTAPHTPFHLPPSNLFYSKKLKENPSNLSYYLAMIESLDIEIGRLLSSIPKKDLANTIIIFIGDNGTPARVLQAYPKRHGKGSVYEGGVNTPLIVYGNSIHKGKINNSLIHATDLFATIANLAGINIEKINDSISFAPLLTKSQNRTTRKYLYSMASRNNKQIYAIRNEKYKLIKYKNKRSELYNLKMDPYEKNNLNSIFYYIYFQKNLEELNQALNQLIDLK